MLGIPPLKRIEYACRVVFVGAVALSSVVVVVVRARINTFAGLSPEYL